MGDLREKEELFLVGKHHILVQGKSCQRNNGVSSEACIFSVDEDYEEFLLLVESCMVSFDFKVNCYCLVPRSYQLLIEVDEDMVEEALSWLNNAYIRYYNAIHTTSECKLDKIVESIYIVDDSSILKLSRELHNVPIDVKLTKSLKDYKWSSYNSYVRGVRDGITNSSQILDCFNNDRRLYQKFVSGKMTSNDEKKLQLALEQRKKEYRSKRGDEEGEAFLE